MRRRLALLVSATMALTLFAFVVPLAILIRAIAADRATAAATDDVRSVSTLIAAHPHALRGAIRFAGRKVTVYLPGQTPLGFPAPRTLAVRLAARGKSITVDDPGGRQILVAVQGRAAPSSSGRSSPTRSSARESVGRGAYSLRSP